MACLPLPMKRDPPAAQRWQRFANKAWDIERSSIGTAPFLVEAIGLIDGLGYFLCHRAGKRALLHHGFEVGHPVADPLYRVRIRGIDHLRSRGVLGEWRSCQRSRVLDLLRKDSSRAGIASAIRIDQGRLEFLQGRHYLAPPYFLTNSSTLFDALKSGIWTS